MALQNFGFRALSLIGPLTVLLGAGQASADGIGDLKPLPHDCRLAVFARDLPKTGVEFSFEAPHIGGSHGGAIFEFETLPHHIAVMADGKWLGIEWRRNGKLVAKVINVAVNPLPDERVIIAYNALDEEEQAHLSCSRRQPPPVDVPDEL